MQKFNYVALDAQGKEQRGVVEAKDQSQAIAALRQHNLVPQTVSPVAGGGKAKSKSMGAMEINIKMPAFLRGRVKPKDLMVLTRQLATLVKSSLPLEEALLAVSQQTEKPRVRNIMLERERHTEWVRAELAGKE